MLIYIKKFYKWEYKYPLIRERYDKLTDKVIETFSVNKLKNLIQYFSKDNNRPILN